MSCYVIVGGQWGDEGKAKAIDYLCVHAKYIVRYQGGANAGHTVIREGKKFVFHLIPSGVLHHDKICVIGNGVAFDPKQFLYELDMLKNAGVMLQNRLYISAYAHLILPYHQILDQQREALLQEGKIGTTGCGIGPCYSDKMSREGFRIIDLYQAGFKSRLRSVIESRNLFLKDLYQQTPLDFDAIFTLYQHYAQVIQPYLTDVSYLLNKALNNGETVLCEGAQGTMLDIDFGTYPFVTSSNTTSGGASTGTGIPPNKISKVIAVMKAYITRVGEGIFPTEIYGELAHTLQQRGHEYGSTTGRLRRVGWFDAVLGRHAVMLNGVSEIFLTKLDILDQLQTIRVCVGYRINGILMHELPFSWSYTDNIEPLYKELPGWQTDTRNITHYHDLPQQTKDFVTFLQSEVNTRITYVSVGAERESTIQVTA